MVERHSDKMEAGGSIPPSPTRSIRYKSDLLEKITSEREENPIFSDELKFVPEITSAQSKSVQTFFIILPNLIHKSRKKNLKK